MAYPKVILSGCLLVALLSTQARAQDTGWKRTFVPEAVGSYLPTSKSDVLIAAAGDSSTNLTSAAKALETAVRLSGHAGLVMDSASLGPLAGLDDGQIVKKAGVLPVGRVLILRLFPAGPGEPWRAVVTQYNKSGNVLGAFSATAGSPLEMAGEKNEASAGEGINARAAEEVAEKVATYKAGSSKAQDTYERFFIGFDDWAAVTTSGNTVRTWTQPWQGKYKKPLNGADFYVAVGRKDLADKYNSAQSTKVVVTVVGIACGVLGFYLTMKAIDDMGNSTGDDVSSSSSNEGLGLALMGVGGAAAFLPWLFSSHPVDAPEARRLADEHNQKLKSKLGLATDEEGSSSQTTATGQRLTLSPAAYASSTGAVFGVVGRY